MNATFKTVVTLCTAALLGSCSPAPKGQQGVVPTPEETSLFTSNDSELDQIYAWARKMALSYAHDGQTDPVGSWYEAALPQREAFCMRDVSHQIIGAEVLGLKAHNKNMMHRFAENISESKDWCTYWEINRYNKPAPADYLNDKEFWYNLNANFDVMQACVKLYEWTGDEDFLNDTTFTHFYAKSTHEYVERWQLQPEQIMDRPPYMNQTEPMDFSNNFHICRGLPSYVENFRGLTLGVDLLATMQAGWRAYAHMATLKGDTQLAAEAFSKADAFRQILDERWWSEENQHYETFWTVEKKYYRGEGVPFILWFDATDRTERIRASVTDILSRPDWNVENLSAFPALLYRLGYYDEALQVLRQLPKEDRSAYPEVSYGVIEGMACGLMGIVPSASSQRITTCARFGKPSLEASLDNVPLLGGSISVKHEGTRSTTLTNRTGRELTWCATFCGALKEISCNGTTYTAVQRTLPSGTLISEAEIPLPAGTTLNAKGIE